MEMGKSHAGKTFVDYLGGQPHKVTLDADGKGNFTVGGGSVAVWIEEG